MVIRRTIALGLMLVLILSTQAMAASSQVKQVLYVALDQLGTPYALISDAPDSFNCLSFVVYCFNQVNRGMISNSGINGKYKRIKSIQNLKSGDILCFKTTKQEIGILGYHFGIYMGKGYFIHASSHAGKVLVSTMKNYKKRFAGAVRVL